MKYWMLLEDQRSEHIYFWNKKYAVRVYHPDHESTFPEVLTGFTKEMNIACQAAYDSGSRIICTAGKTFEVLASGRV